MPNTECLQLRTALPVQALNAGLFISKGERSHPKHTTESYELIFVRQGILGIQEEGRIYRIEPGEVLVLRPDREHGSIEQDPEDLQYYWVHFTIDQPNTSDQGSLINIPRLCKVSRPDKLTGLFRRLLDDQEAKCLDQMSADMLLMLILNQVALSRTPDEYLEGSATLIAQRAETYIRNHFHEPLSTSSIAKALDYNPDYLGRAFRSVYETTVTTYLRRLRLSHARSLLMDSGMSVAQIARECGCEDAGYFRRLFHRHEGISPLAYRRLYARASISSE